MYVFAKSFYFISSFILLTFIYYGFNGFSNNPYVHSNTTLGLSEPIESIPTKYILYWTPFWNIKDYGLGSGSKPFENCEYKNCYSTFDKKLLPIEEYDALIFHGVRTANDEVVPPATLRQPHQYYIYMNAEAPVHFPKNISLELSKSFFNWTMTYRFDSDFIRRHGVVTKTETNYKFPSKEKMKKKKKLIAWFVSNCNTSSKREILSEEIKKFIKVDVYGSCGKLSCKHNTKHSKLSSKECYDMVEKNYKFYFSFENSYCKDYSTEKLYNILQRNIVPVVYGAGDYNLSAPPSSVINVENYDNVRQLVNYLKFLNKNDDKYLEYFEWKKHYYIASSTPSTNCELCRKLNEKKKFIYDDINSWWWGAKRPVCKSNKDLPKIVSDLL